MNNIRHHRLLTGRSLRDVAMSCRIHCTDLSRLERNQAPLHPGWRTRIAAVLNVAPELL